MAYTPMKTWGSETLTSSDMTTYLTNNIEYLYGITQGLVFSGTQLTRSAATSIADSTTTPITWTTEGFDIGGWWSSGTDIIVPAGAIPSGFTEIAIAVFMRTVFATDADGNRRIQTLVNGSAFGSVNVAGIAGDSIDLALAEVTTVAAGDVITATVYHTAGASLNVSNTQITIYRIAPTT